MKRFWIWLVMATIGLAAGACVALTTDNAAIPFSGTTSADNEVVIFAAASLTDAVNELGAAFEASHPGVAIVTNYAGSSGLATQLLEGAQADLFAPANQTQMENVADAGLLVAAPQLFATNRLVAIVPANNPVHVGSFADLAKADVRLVLAVPGVPVRDYTDAMLVSLADDPEYGAAFADALYANLASEEANVRQVVAKVALGEADAGIVYASDVTPEIVDKVQQISLPAAHTQPVTYPIARLAGRAEPAHAQAFVDFILSAEGQAILERWGFGPRTE